MVIFRHQMLILGSGDRSPRNLPFNRSPPYPLLPEQKRDRTRVAQDCWNRHRSYAGDVHTSPAELRRKHVRDGVLHGERFSPLVGERLAEFLREFRSHRLSIQPLDGVKLWKVVRKRASAPLRRGHTGRSHRKASIAIDRILTVASNRSAAKPPQGAWCWSHVAGQRSWMRPPPRRGHRSRASECRPVVLRWGSRRRP